MFTIEGCGERWSLWCTSEKEASKLFGLYLDHKSSLPKLEESGKVVDVNIYNESIECKFQLWKARDKVVAEASFYKMVRKGAVNSNVNYLQWICIIFFLFLDIISDSLVKYLRNIKHFPC